MSQQRYACRKVKRLPKLQMPHKNEVLTRDSLAVHLREPMQTIEAVPVGKHRPAWP